jgi:osmotically-inducible protein OsmY
MNKEVLMSRNPLGVGMIGIAALALATLGCDDTAKGVKKDAEENAEAAKPYVDAAAEKTKEALKDAAAAAKPAAEEAGEKLKELGDKAVQEARELGDKTEDAADTAADETARGADRAGDKAEDAGDAVSAAAQTTMVKAALMADKDVDASRIDVDTEANTRTVMLKGTVPTAAQKTTAERIAKSKVAKGYSVRNMLTVAAKS